MSPSMMTVCPCNIFQIETWDSRLWDFRTTYNLQPFSLFRLRHCLLSLCFSGFCWTEVILRLWNFRTALNQRLRSGFLSQRLKRTPWSSWLRSPMTLGRWSVDWKILNRSTWWATKEAVCMQAWSRKGFVPSDCNCRVKDWWPWPPRLSCWTTTKKEVLGMRSSYSRAWMAIPLMANQRYQIAGWCHPLASNLSRRGMWSFVRLEWWWLKKPSKPAWVWGPDCRVWVTDTTHTETSQVR